MVRRALLLCVSILSIGCTQNHTASDTGVSFPEELKWIAPGADIAAHLTQEPAECIPVLGNDKQSQELKLGRLAFRSPYLLGGQATRRGLSCQSCHTNGAVNSEFFIDGLSGAPGTADVTSFHFSTILGDETFNPKAIPNLVVLTKPTDEISQKARETFILRLIQAEFDGSLPPQEVSDAIVAYVNALDLKQCTAATLSERDVLNHHLKIIDTGLELMNSPSFQFDRILGFVQSATRNEMGRLSRRYPESPYLQQGLIALSAKIKTFNQADYKEIANDWRELKPLFEKQFEQSYYNEDYVRAASFGN